ncbi:hypothetical protein [Dyella subtropica]|uniref:hypothetical protein n=1 Tax=Dyella subtropica TaxID=2992127 RepID=UPI00225C0A50|nr:hypothetical protein [Dyella subtropica]
MMLPNRPIAPPPDGTNVTPADQAMPQPTATEAVATVKPGENPHVDYNLHPLKVDGLEHYIEQLVGDERFHVT